MFGCGVLKCRVPESVLFCMDNIPMYIFWYRPIPTLYSMVTIITEDLHITLYISNLFSINILIGGIFLLKEFSKKEGFSTKKKFLSK